MDLAIPTIWVQTNDNNKCQMPHQEIKQIKTLQLLLAHQKGSNSSENPINAHMIDAQSLQLIRTGLANPTLEDFDSFYYNLNPTNLHLLINATDTLEVPLLRVLCAQKAFPSDIQKQIMPSLINAITGVIMQKNITKKPLLLESNNGRDEIFKSITWSNDERLIISTCNDSLPHNCVLWNASTGLKVWSGDQLQLNAQRIGPVAFNSTGKKVALSFELIQSNFQNLCRLAIQHENGVTATFRHRFTYLPNSMAWSPDNTKIALGFSILENPNFYLLDALTADTITTQQMDSIYQLVFCPNSKTIIAHCSENIHMWDPTQSEQIKTFCVPYPTLVLMNIKIALNAEGTKIIIGYESAEKPIILDLTTGNTTTDLSPQNSRCVAWSPDGTKIAAAGFAQEKPSIAIWDALTGHELVRFHKDKTHAIAFSPTSKKIVAAGCAYQQSAIYTLLNDEDEECITQLKHFDIVQLWLTYELIRRARDKIQNRFSELESAVLIRLLNQHANY